MRRIYTLFVFMTLCVVAFGQKAIFITRTNGVTDAFAESEAELTFSQDGHTMIVNGQYLYPIADVVDITYAELPKKLLVNFNGASSSVVNPFITLGVTVLVDGASVTVTNPDEETEITTQLTGSTTQGGFTYVGSYKTTVELNGVDISNPYGAAVDIQCGKRVALELKKGTANMLADAPNGEQKAALYCKGHLEIDKSGDLTVRGNAKHAIAAKEYIQVKNGVGNIRILSAVGDGIHAGQYFVANGGNFVMNNVLGDGIQAELSSETDYAEDYPNGSLTINGGSFDITLATDSVDALKADGPLTISNIKSEPVIKIAASGKSAKGIKADGALQLLAGDITVSMTGSAGKGIKAATTLTIGSQSSGDGPKLHVSTTGSRLSGTTTGGTGMGGFWPGGRPGGGGNRPGGGESSGGSSAKAIKAQGAVVVYGGELEVSTAAEGAEGLESKTGIEFMGGRSYFKCYDDCINCSAAIKFTDGIIVCYSFGNDAIDSNYGRSGAVVIRDASLLTYSTKGGAEMGLDCDGMGYVQITGRANVVALGGNQGGGSSSSLGSSTQGYGMVTTSTNYTSTPYYTLANGAGDNLITFKLEGNVKSTCAVYTASGMARSATHTVKSATTAPTDATISFHGLYLGSSAKGTTNVVSFTSK